MFLKLIRTFCTIHALIIFIFKALMFKPLIEYRNNPICIVMCGFLHDTTCL
jgi:hypothetical protein